MKLPSNIVIGQLIKALRRYHGISQFELSEILACSQSKISKYEMGTLEISAIELIKLCSHFKLPLEAFIYGFIDFDIKKHQNHRKMEDEYKIPHQYFYNSHYTVRAFQPFIKFAEEKHGIEIVQSFLENELNIDRSYLCILNVKLNDLFLFHFVNKFEIRKNEIISFISSNFKGEKFHGSLHSLYMKASSPESLIKKYIANTYSYDNEYLIELDSFCKNCIDLTYTPINRTALEDICPGFHKLYIESLNKYLLPNHQFRIEEMSSSTQKQFRIHLNEHYP